MSDPATRPTLSAVIPTFNGGRHLERCLDALEAVPEVEEILVLDGGSTDGSPDRAAERSRVKVTSAPGTPFIARYNSGVEAARNELVLVLNDDAFVDPHTPRLLADVLIERPRVAICGARLRYDDGSDQRSGGHYRLLLDDILTTLALARLNRMRGRHAPPHKPAGVEDVTWMPYCAAVLRRGAFLQIGGFDERFTFYFDDQDTCRRLVESGWELAIRWDAGAVHIGGATTSSRNPPAWFARYHENRFIYLRKFYPRTWVVAAAIWVPRALLHIISWRARAGWYRLRGDRTAAAAASDWARAFQDALRKVRRARPAV